MTLEDALSYWIKSAERDLAAAQDLFKTKHFVQCLFYCHLAVEKIIKALIVKNKKEPPPVHHLPYLSKLTGIKFSSEQQTLIKEINEFNLRARYDDYKFRFYKIADKEFTQKYFQKTKDFHLWLKKHL